ncbi:MAG: PAS domain S-box protein [Ardenticatenaceae bacterium]|nr:PAS domain S-box protein [Ardenticatenaceae bacterium]
MGIPDQFLAYFLLLVYGAAFAYFVYVNRAYFTSTTRQQWQYTAVLTLTALLFSQLLPIRLSFNNQLAPLFAVQNPITVFIPFATVSFLLAAAILNPLAALIVGTASGLGHAWGQTHQLFDIFHYAFAGVLAAASFQQHYRSRLAQWLRHPVSGGAAVTAVLIIPLALATYVTTDANAGSLVAVDLALSTASANFWPLVIEGAFGGFIVWLILRGMPHLRPTHSLIPSPFDVNLRKRLLSNFVRFAIVLTILLVTVVFNLSAYLATRLVVNQMAHDAQTVLAELPTFQSNLQGLIEQYEANEALANGLENDKRSLLRQMYRSNPPFYRGLILVEANQTVSAVVPDDLQNATLSEQELTAVAEAIRTNTPQVSAAATPTPEHVLSLIVPIIDNNGEASAALVGRVPELSLESLIVGLQGTVGKGTGFIVDDKNRIIAHTDSSRLLSEWERPFNDSQRTINTDSTAAGRDNGRDNGRAYQSRQESSNARELVYEITGSNPAWTVVITVPYEVVLRLAWSIGWPLGLVLIIFAGLFYFNLDKIGREITEPITELVQASKTIAAGGSLTNPIPTDRDDELGQLGQAFAQMQRSLKQRLDELSLLLSVSHDVSSSIDLNQSMPVILQGTLRGTGAAGARAVLVNPSGGHPLTFGEGPAAPAMAELDRPIMFQLRDKPEMLLASPNQIVSTLFLERADPLPVRAIFAIPLHAHDRFQGIVWLGYRQPRNFTMDERNLLHTLVGQTSVVVENARLFATAEGGRRRLAAVLASTSDAVIVTDQTERVLLANPAFEKIFGLSANEITGRAVVDVIPSPELIHTLTGAEAVGMEVNGENGRTYYTNASTIIRNDGQVLGRVAVLHDITHFKELDELKSEFVSTVSHDLRSPLTYMRGYGNMLSMVGELNEKQKEYVEKILSGITQMSNLVDDLLELARADAGVDMKQDDIQMGPLINDIANEYWQHAHYNGINIELDIAPNLPIIRGSEMVLRRAITNYVTNAIKYAPNSGPMTIKAEQVNGEIIVSVRDNGPGIPPEDVVRVFERFVRLKQRGQEQIKGSGLGLAIVRSYIEQHGGRTWCQSQVGKGSTFGLSLPAKKQESGHP